MEGLTATYIDNILSDNRSFPLENLQNIYFKNIGDTPVKIGLFPLQPYEEFRINTGNYVLEKKTIDILFKDGIGTSPKLYVSYSKITVCPCEEQNHH